MKHILLLHSTLCASCFSSTNTTLCFAILKFYRFRNWRFLYFYTKTKKLEFPIGWFIFLITMASSNVLKTWKRLKTRDYSSLWCFLKSAPIFQWFQVQKICKLHKVSSPLSINEVVYVMSSLDFDISKEIDLELEENEFWSITFINFLPFSGLLWHKQAHLPLGRHKSYQSVTKFYYRKK